MMYMIRKALILSLIAVAVATPAAAGQSGATGGRAAGSRQYGVNLMFAVYQYDAVRSPAIEEVTRLASTFSTAQEEVAYLKEKHKLQEVDVRHFRSVGLRSDETFRDAVLLGPEYMTFSLTPREIVRGYMKLDIKVRYANAGMLEAGGVEFENFETVLLRGGKGMFGLKVFVGAGGRQESAPAERTLIVSITPEIVPLASLKNRPEQLSHPVNEYGSPIETKASDRFTPPVALDRVAPRFEAGRGVRGSVLVSGVITPEGKVINVRVLRSLDPIIDDRAVAAFRQYNFSPALLNGQPVHATYREEITFSAPAPSAVEQEQELDKQREKEKQKSRRRWPF